MGDDIQIAWSSPRFFTSPRVNQQRMMLKRLNLIP
jgi:hypothetical protein